MDRAWSFYLHGCGFESCGGRHFGSIMTTIPAHKRRRIYERDDGRCHYCRLTLWVDDYIESSPRRATLDHKTPLSRGGTNDDDNLVACCNRCNNEKRDIPYEMYRWYRHMLMRGHSREELLEAIEIVLEEDSPPTEFSPRANSR